MLDLTAVGAIDVHCHPWRNGDLLARDLASFEDRTTMMGMYVYGADSGEV